MIVKETVTCIVNKSKEFENTGKHKLPASRKTLMLTKMARGN